MPWCHLDWRGVPAVCHCLAASDRMLMNEPTNELTIKQAGRRLDLRA